ncbi:pre-rRNA-processing protein TSR2 homolog [Nerophis lumbriciformis]|uniref:pre-rRNA-processing protein TSR2 homolog n=1 Tax=Nerophis lumbriciformis TaxID=546530 RepID=UPI003BA99BC3
MAWIVSVWSTSAHRHRLRMCVPSNMAAPGDSRAVFTDGVRAVLHTWPVLQIAVDNGFGGVYGQQKADWMADVVQQYFHDNTDLDQCEVEDYIATLMDQEFHTVVDDGSLPQVCVGLMQMFSQWQQGALEQLTHSIQSLTQNKTLRAKVTVVPTPPESESDEETQAMECETTSVNITNHPPPPPPPQDEDGWTLVQKRK